ncbi:MAG: acyltransferase family protein [Fluviicola sp.]
MKPNRYFSSALEKEKKQLGHIESLRALAALMVLVFHFLSFTGVDGFLIENAQLRESSKFGAQGVELFYIISGFVIYYSLSNTNPVSYNYLKYIGKRFARIFPPFLGTLFLICVIALLWKGNYGYTAKQILENATLTVDLFRDSEWMNPIFVTLKVEFLFYLLIGFLVIWMRKSLWIYGVILFSSLLSVLFFHSIDIVHNIPFFVAGIACSEIYRSKHILVNSLLLTGSMLVLIFIFPGEDILVLSLGIAFLLWLKIKSAWLEWMGQFSYSLYLTHGLSGGLFLFVFKNPNYVNLNSWLALILALVVALVFAYCYYLIVEKRAMSWSRKINY